MLDAVFLALQFTIQSLAFAANGPTPFGGQILTNTRGGENATEGSCGGGTGGERALYLQIQSASDLTFETWDSDEIFFPVIYLRSACGVPESEMACAHFNVAQHDARIEIDNVPAGRYWLFVDTDGVPGWTTVIVTVRAR